MNKLTAALFVIAALSGCATRDLGNYQAPTGHSDLSVQDTVGLIAGKIAAKGQTPAVMGNVVSRSEHRCSMGCATWTISFTAIPEGTGSKVVATAQFVSDAIYGYETTPSAPVPYFFADAEKTALEQGLVKWFK